MLETGSAVPEPAFEIAAVDDAEDQDHAILLQDVVHHSVVADAEAVERVPDSLDRPDTLACDTSGRGGIDRELVERSHDPSALAGGQLPEGANRRRRQLDLERPQSRSRRFVVRPCE